MDQHEPASLFGDDLYSSTDQSDNDVTVRDARGLLAELERELSAIESAVGQIEDGSYGKCDVCGQQIDPQLLGSDPAAHRCALHRELERS